MQTCPKYFKIGNLANPWYNTGTICLANTSFDLENPIHGGGCITVGENSKFDIGGIDVQQQTVYLSDSTSVLKVTTRTGRPCLWSWEWEWFFNSTVSI